MNELTQKEKDFLTMLLAIGRIIIEGADGYYSMGNDTFDRNELFRLACKFGVEDYY